MIKKDDIERALRVSDTYSRRQRMSALFTERGVDELGLYYCAHVRALRAAAWFDSAPTAGSPGLQGLMLSNQALEIVPLLASMFIDGWAARSNVGEAMPIELEGVEE